MANFIHTSSLQLQTPTFVVVPDAQLAELAEAEDALDGEDVQLAVLEGTPVGLRVLQVQLPRVAVDTEQNHIHVGVRPRPPHVGGLHADLVVRLCNSTLLG